MSREIKFRAWDKETKCMITGKRNLVGFDGGIIPQNREEWKADQFEIMQFTGLKDKNGKEIYEGDIYYWQGEKRYVLYDEEWSGFISRTGFGQDTYIYLHMDGAEIIGNIYENPDLLHRGKAYDIIAILKGDK